MLYSINYFIGGIRMSEKYVPKNQEIESSHTQVKQEIKKPNPEPKSIQVFIADEDTVNGKK